jgi:hypothetical protein
VRDDDGDDDDDNNNSFVSAEHANKALLTGITMGTKQWRYLSNEDVRRFITPQTRGRRRFGVSLQQPALWVPEIAVGAGEVRRRVGPNGGWGEAAPLSERTSVSQASWQRQKQARVARRAERAALCADSRWRWAGLTTDFGMATAGGLA